jgi:hypothetical protein
MSQAELRVYAGCPLGSGPIRPTRNGETSVERVATKVVVSTALIIDQELARILAGDAMSGESVQRAFDRKEREVRELVGSLSQLEAAALLMRITSERAGAKTSMLRLTAERRSRIVAYVTFVSRGRTVEK